MQVNWIKSTTDTWLSLERVNLANVRTVGVYMIWHTGNPGRVVRVGQGDIAERLTAHRRDPAITQFAKYGELRVTWASVPAVSLDGVERYLANRWKPLAGDAFPDSIPVAVNSPWG